MNYTEQEALSHRKFSQKIYNRTPEQKEKRRLYQANYRKEHPDRVKKTAKKCYYDKRSQRLREARQYQKLPCKDPVLGDTVTYNCLLLRIRYHKEIYGDIRAKDYLIHIPKIKGLDLLSEEQKRMLEQSKAENKEC